MRLIIACLAAFCAAAVPAAAQVAPPAPPPSVGNVAPTAPVAPVAPANLSLRRYPNTESVTLQNLAAYVRVRPEARDDIAVAVINEGPLAAPNVRASGRRLVIDGRQRGQLLTCTVRGPTGFEVRTRRQGRVGGAQLPVIEIRTPLDAHVSARGAVRMHVGAAENAEISLDGCGDVDIERVDETAQVVAAGYADLRIFDAGELIAAIAGDGSVDAGIVRDGLTVSIAGGGAFSATRVDGDANIVIQGAGRAAIEGGQAEAMTVVINGSGQFTHRGSAETLDTVIIGNGDVRVREVEGEVSRRVLGRGAVVIGR